METTSAFDSEYELQEKLGGGPMSMVYRATERKGNRAVTVKFLSPKLVGAEDAMQRLANEGVALAKLSHPHIVRVVGFGLNGEVPYLVNEYVVGRSLSDELHDRERLPAPEALRIFRQILQGLAAAHQAGIVHRDIAPGNILLDQKGDVRITDFGLARIGGGCSTGTGMVLGTPAYMAPEQARDPRVEPPADLYSAAAVLFTMVTGETPYSEENAMMMMLRHQKDPVPKAGERAEGVPEAIEQLIEIGMRKDPRDRPTDAVSYIRECILVEDHLGITR